MVTFGTGVPQYGSYTVTGKPGFGYFFSDRPNKLSIKTKVWVVYNRKRKCKNKTTSFLLQITGTIRKSVEHSSHTMCQLTP